MEPCEYDAMYALECRHWWFQSRLCMIETLMARHVWPALGGGRPRLLDIGCGTGLFLERRAADCATVGIDFSGQALGYCRRRHVGALARADATRLPFEDASFDVVTAFDLIEHVQDDRALVEEAWRVLRPGGFLVASVPAHPLLWTGHDVSLHHHRRYRRAQFEALFAPVGPAWERVRMTAGFMGVFPFAAAMRCGRRLLAGGGAPRSDTRPAPAWLNRLMVRLHRGEAAWLRRHDLPIGISFFTIRRKPAGA